MIRRALVALVLVVVVSGLGLRAGGSQSAGVAAAGKTINIGNIGWDEDVAVNNVVQVLLQDKYGYTVNQKLADAGILYQGVASGSLDAFLDTWATKRLLKRNPFWSTSPNVKPRCCACSLRERPTPR